MKLDRALFGRARSDLRWWQRRAARRGPRAVVSLAHARTEIEALTAQQQAMLFPLLRAELLGHERDVLDFGCGTGRFTAALAELVGGRAVGVDPIQSLIDFAPAHPAVEYRVMHDGRIPANDASFDIVWICLVLMGITDRGALEKTLSEIRRVLRPRGMLFLIENTSTREDLPHLTYRSVEDYRRLIPFVPLREVGEYEDAGERISVLAGRCA